MNPQYPSNFDQPEGDTLARVDRLVNTAMDAEAANDFDGANIAWAKIASMDDASRRSAATLQASLESLRTPAQSPDVSAKVLARLGMKPVSKSHEANVEQVRVAPVVAVSSQSTAPATPALSASPRHVSSSRVASSTQLASSTRLATSHRSRKWYSLSPVLASFVLGGFASLGLVIAHQYTNPSLQPDTAIVVVPLPSISHTIPSELLPAPVASASRAPSLRMGDTSRYDQALAPARPGTADAGATHGYWWRVQGPQSPSFPMMAQERWWIAPGSAEGPALEPKHMDAGQMLLHKHSHDVDLFQLLLGDHAHHRTDPSDLNTPAPTPATKLQPAKVR